MTRQFVARFIDTPIAHMVLGKVLTIAGTVHTRNNTPVIPVASMAMVP